MQIKISDTGDKQLLYERHKFSPKAKENYFKRMQMKFYQIKKRDYTNMKHELWHHISKEQMSVGYF